MGDFFTASPVVAFTLLLEYIIHYNIIVSLEVIKKIISSFVQTYFSNSKFVLAVISLLFVPSCYLWLVF